MSAGVKPACETRPTDPEVAVPAYVFYEADVTDPVAYEVYKARAEVTVREAGGRYVVRGGDPITLEGEPPTRRTVLLEFPDVDAAQAWYTSDAYAEAKARRDGAAVARVYVLPGWTS